MCSSFGCRDAENFEAAKSYEFYVAHGKTEDPNFAEVHEYFETWDEAYKEANRLSRFTDGEYVFVISELGHLKFAPLTKKVIEVIEPQSKDYFGAYDDSISDRQEWLIGELGGKVDKSMNRSEASDYIKELQGKESGTWKDAESCGNCGNALVMNAEGEHHCGCGTEAQGAETFEARTYRKGERRNRRSMRKSRRNANLRAMKRQKGMMRMAAETDSEAVEQTDANMVSEGSVEAFYGGGAKVSVSGDNIMPTSNPSVDEAFDVGNQVGLDIAEQEVMNVNPSVEVNYGAEAFEANSDSARLNELYRFENEVYKLDSDLYTRAMDIAEEGMGGRDDDATRLNILLRFENEVYKMDSDILNQAYRKVDEMMGAESFEAEKRYRYGNRYITRDSKGRFKKNVDVGRSLAADRRQKAKTKVSGEGQGGVGDYEAEDIVESLQNRSQRVGFSMNGWVASILVIGASFFAGRRFEKR